MDHMTPHIGHGGGCRHSHAGLFHSPLPRKVIYKPVSTSILNITYIYMSLTPLHKRWDA